MKQIICPTCGGNLGELPEIGRLKHVLPKLQFQIAETIYNAGAGGIKAAGIAKAIYGDRFEKDDFKAKSVKANISHLRPRIEPFGFFIPKANAIHQKYRMQALEVSA